MTRMTRMTRALARRGKLFMAPAVCVLCLAAPPALAEDLTYPGNGTLTTVNGVSNSLAPGGSGGGANASKSDSLSGNRVTVNGGTISGNVYGGVNTIPSDTDAGTNNQLTITGGQAGSVYGGYSGAGAAAGNRVTVTGGSAGQIYGGYSGGNVNAERNSVTVTGGRAASVTGGESYGAEANYNIVRIGGSALVEGSIMGAYGATGAVGNSVSIGGGAVVQYDVKGGSTYSGDAAYNSVTISGGIFTPAQYADAEIYGGYTSDGNAIHNTVTISGAPDLSLWTIGGGAGFYGTDYFTGNTLNLRTANLTVAEMKNFQRLNFYLPAPWGAGSTMLSIASSGTADLTDGSARSAIVQLDIDGAAPPLKAGEQVILIDARAGTLTSNADLNPTAVGLHGVTLKYDFGIQAANGLLSATVRGISVNERAKALSEGFLAGLALVDQGADLAAGPGMAEAVRAAPLADMSTGCRIAGFGALSGGSAHYGTGSHVDMLSLSLLAGLSWCADLTPGRLTLGAFFEYGNGSYDTNNSFSNAASVHGDGDADYLGGGVLGRMDFIDAGPGHIHAEASFRAGGVHNEYSSSDLRDPLGRKAEYDTSSAYYGFHLGAGYVWNITDAASLDIYGKYFWTRLEGESVTLPTGDPVTFKDADSSRLRLGGRLAYAINEHVSPYVGAAWEHEFDGRARAATNGYDMDAPSLRGDTGIGELGLTLKPSSTLPLSFDLGVRGHAGKREGVTGSLRVKFEF